MRDIHICTYIELFNVARILPSNDDNWRERESRLDSELGLGLGLGLWLKEDQKMKTMDNPEQQNVN